MLRRTLAVVTVCLVCALPGSAETMRPPQPAAGEGAPADKRAAAATHRLREGETIEMTGKLELSGDRAIFHPGADHAPLRVLENLALERITRVLSETREEREWVVSGTITEYRGANYILIDRAVQRSRQAATAK